MPGPTTDTQNERKHLRANLYTGHMTAGSGRGGAKIQESSADEKKPGLVQMWPKYLDMEINASKPTLTLPDVNDMIDRRKTPRFHAMVPRDLSGAELRAVQSWYEVAKQNVEEKLGPALAAAQANIMLSLIHI